MKNVNYKLLALIPLLALSGCKKQEHINVVTEKVTNDTERLFLLSDIQSGQKRAFFYASGNRESLYDYLKVGDTITISTGGTLLSNRNYQKHLVLRGGEVEIAFNVDTLRARQQQAVKTR
ncbi:MAG: hypothetical protein IK122_00555 [Alphaproteobacteria bacterium]|nr:hypothetical protein [Alphaproteobacteria bacterium]